MKQKQNEFIVILNEVHSLQLGARVDLSNIVFCCCLNAKQIIRMAERASVCMLIKIGSLRVRVCLHIAHCALNRKWMCDFGIDRIICACAYSRAFVCMTKEREEFQ